MIPIIISMVDNIINRRLRFGYDVGKGFVVGEEEMLGQFDRISSMLAKSIAQELRRRAEATRLDVIRSLGELHLDWGLKPLCSFSFCIFVDLIHESGVILSHIMPH